MTQQTTQIPKLMTSQPTLTSLANSAAWKALEDRWLTVIEEPDVPRDDLLEALALMNKAGRGQQAAALGWSWLATERARSSPNELLALGRELIVRCGDNDEMRQEILRLYEEVFADRPELKRLIDASGLRGGKSPRRALRTLEICLGLKEGDVLVARADEHVAKVLTIDLDACEYTLKTKRGEITVDADALALAYDPVAPNDFRVLNQIHPEQIRNMLEADPVALVIGVLQSHRGRLDSDQLEHLLCPNFLTAQNWPQWWTKAKTALKRCSNVIVEGRNPVLLTYVAQGQTLENEIEPQWVRAETPSQRLAVVETYFREAKARRSDVKPAMVKRFHQSLLDRVAAARKGSPIDAVMEAIIIDRLVELAKLPAADHNPAQAILEESSDLTNLLKQIPETPFFLRAAEIARRIRPDDWHQMYAEVLPFAPVEGCDVLAKALDQAGHRNLLEQAVQRIPTDFTQHLDALCWLWRRPSVQGIQPLSDRELLLKLLSELAELTRVDTTAAGFLRDARLKIRAVLGATKFSRYREVIEGMDANLASTVRRTIERLDGLGQVVRATLLKIIQETHHELYV
jgi:transcription elongation factor GreA